MQINQYPLESFSFQDDDYYDIDFWTGSGYETRKILGSVIKAGIAAAISTLYNADGSLNSNRVIDLNSHLLTFSGTNSSEQFKVQFNDGAGTSSIFLQTLAQIYCEMLTSASSNVASFDLNPVSTQLKIQDGTNESRFEVTIYNSAINFNDGVTNYRVAANTNGIEINSSYFLPATDGTAGQIIKTDGFGTLSWIDAPTTIVSWGDIVGSLAAQTDLQLALDAKFDDPSGLPSQYIRGDGSLADFPAPVGAGSAVSFYLNGGTSQGTILGGQYYQLGENADLGTNADFTLNANGLIAQFITDNASPKRTLIPAGNWNLQFYFSASSGGGSPTFYAEVHKYDGTTFTLLGSSVVSPEGITGGTSIDLYYTSVAIPETILDVDDRIAVRVYITHDGRTITLHTQASHLSEVITTFSTGIATLNGLTEQVQYFALGSSGTNLSITSSGDTHTFNFPVASTTATGILNATDWTTFNNKADDNIYTADGTISGDRVVSMDVNDFTISSSNAANQFDVTFDDGTRQTQLALSLGSISKYVKSASGDFLTTGYGATSTNTTISNVGSTIFSEVIGSQNNITWRVVNGGTTRRLELNTLGLRVNNAYYLPATDGTSGQVLRTNGLGIASWITPSSGTVTSVGLSTGTTGTDVNVSGSPVTGSGSITLNIPTASATNRGALSAADWTTFNSKANTASPAFTGTPTTPTAATGTNTTQVASTAFVQDALSKQAEAIQVAASDEISALSVGTGKTTFRMPYGMTLTGIRASLTTAQTSGTIFTIDVKQNGVSILSTLLTIDNTERTSTTAATPAVISTSALTDDSEMRIDVTQIGDGTAKGLKITLLGTRV